MCSAEASSRINRKWGSCVKRWTYGLNGYHRTCTVELQEARAIWFWLEDLADKACALAHKLPRVPLIGRIPVRDPETGERTSLGEYYGDHPGEWFHAWVCSRLCDLMYSAKAPKVKLRVVPMGWDEAKRLLYNDNPSFWDEQEQIGEEMHREREAEREAARTVVPGVVTRVRSGKSEFITEEGYNR